jgi:predicted metal-binding membrane protein
MRHRLVSTVNVDVDVAVAGSPPQRRASLGAASGREPERAMEVQPPVMVAFVVAWSLAIAAELTGVAQHFGHDAVLDRGLPAAAGLGLFLAGWLVMVAAMMLPTIPAVGVVEGPGSARPGGLGPFLGGFAIVWAIVGLAALSLDMVVHEVVHGVPALEARPWLVAAGVLGLAGALQLMSSTRRSLAAGRRVGDRAADGALPAFYAGHRHGRLCLRSDGPLMVVMFAAGGGLAWMAVLTSLMIGERSSRYGSHLAVATGVGLVAAAVVMALDLSWRPRFGSR